MSYTKELYSTIKKDLMSELGFKNVMEIPKLDKIVINIGFKTSDVDNNFLSYVVSQLSLIVGQKAVLTKAKKSIAGFKLRENTPIGCKVTLRGNKMYEFVDRLVYIAMPRIRDFRGLSSKNFNQSGHYTFGIKEHTIFPEVDLDKAYKILGMNITIVTTAKNKEGCGALLRRLNFPIK
ncbi:50S ribosomal protein L5 [Pseudomonadota bacterium]